VLDLTLDDEVVDIVAAGYDAAIRIGEVIEQDMIAIKLGPDLRQVTVASPDYLVRRGIAFSTQQMIAPYVATGRLVPLLEPWSAPFPGYYLC
jgi:DNA-binding transcriptional LysR family regulator